MPAIPGWEFAAMYQSANQVGGDFYDVFRLPQPTGASPIWGMMVADVTGKGIPAALMMAFSHAILQAATFVHQRPGEILSHANKLIIQHSRSGLLLTVFYATLQPETSQLWFANGGHEPPFWYRAAQQDCVELNQGASLLVGARRSTLFPEHSIPLAPGDILVLYTDGVTEARSPSGDFFTSERLQEIIASCGEASAADLLKTILGEIKEFTGERPQADDITLFVIKRDQ
jgi:sigma-B regulation protein RsbU (phosphoserine phosphatase)